MRFSDGLGGMLPTKWVLQTLEEEGKLKDVDMYLFKVLCERLGYWLYSCGKEISVSVNVCPDCLNDLKFPYAYASIMKEYGIPPQLVEVEFLENATLNHTQLIKKLAKSLKNYGICCSLDDFGSGYSSFQVLANVEVDELKIDRSLFTDPENKREQIVVRHIIAAAKELGAKTVAEGVESPEYAKMLRGAGCDYVQGYAFYRPMSTKEFERRFVLSDETANINYPSSYQCHI